MAVFISRWQTKNAAVHVTSRDPAYIPSTLGFFSALQQAQQLLTPFISLGPLARKEFISSRHMYQRATEALESYQHNTVLTPNRNLSNQSYNRPFHYTCPLPTPTITLRSFHGQHIFTWKARLRPRHLHPVALSSLVELEEQGRQDVEAFWS